MREFPELKSFEGSWIVTHLETGEKREFFKTSKEKVKWFFEHPETFKVETIHSYLCNLNESIKAGNY